MLFLIENRDQKLYNGYSSCSEGMGKTNVSYYNIDFSKLSEPQRITIERLLKEYDRQPSLAEALFESDEDWDKKKEWYLQAIIDIVEMSDDPAYQKFLDIYTRVVEPAKGTLQVVGGVTESITGAGLVAGTSWTGVGIPIGVAGGYMAVDGSSNVLGGLSRIKNGLSGSTEHS